MTADVETKREHASPHVNGLLGKIVVGSAIVLAIICGALCGAAFFAEAVGVYKVRPAPVVMGHNVSRRPITEFSVPRVDFTIQVDGSDTRVHAHVQTIREESEGSGLNFQLWRDPSSSEVDATLARFTIQA